MNPIHLYMLPDSASELASWLEAKIFSDELGELIAELFVVNQLDSLAVDIPVVVSDGLERSVVIDGFSSLNRNELGYFLRNPYRLLVVQELILIEQPEHWASKFYHRSQEAIQSEWKTIKREIASETPASEHSIPEQRPKITTSKNRPSRLRRKRSWATLAISATIVAAMAIGFWFIRESLETSPDWGWNDTAIFALELDEADYFRLLAREADDWYDLPKTEKSLRQLVASCDHLIGGNHASLTPNAKAWLVEKCEAWKESLVRLESDQSDLNDQRRFEEVDGVVKKLVAALQRKADEITN